jgi:hypothetical protein
MTVPQIHTLTPPQGLASGRERVIIGCSNVRVPTPPPSTEPSGDYIPTASVTFDGVDADLVAVLSHTRILAVTPAYEGHPNTLPAVVDVVIANLDDDGNPIGGESATLVEGFTFKRPDMTEVSALQWLSRQVLRDLRRNLIDNVALSSSPDWSDDPATSIAAIAKLPAILIEGPELTRNTFYAYDDVRAAAFSDGVGLNAAPLCADVTWDIILLARRKVEALNICDAALRLFRRRPMFVFPTGPTDSTPIECRRYLGDWRAVDRFDDQVFAFESTLRLEALLFDDAEGMPVDEALTYAIDSDPELNLGSMEDDDA